MSDRSHPSRTARPGAATSAHHDGVERQVFRSEAHCGRAVGGLETRDVHALQAAVEMGGMLQSLVYRVRYPEVMLSDLSNPPHAVSLCTSEAILEFHERVRRVTARMPLDDGVSRITGDGLLTELALCGPSKPVLQQLRMRILAQVIDEMNLWTSTTLLPFEARALHDARPIGLLSEPHRALYDEVTRAYAPTIAPGFRERVEILRLSSFYQGHFVWEQIRRLGTNKLFVLCAGLKLALGYVNFTGDTRVHFLEFHRENDPFQLYRVGPPPEILPTSPEGATWVVVDKAYTGGTLNLAAKRLVERYGPSTKVVRVALFPKSYLALQQSDYVVYAGRLYESARVLRCVHPERWHVELFDLPPEPR